MTSRSIRFRQVCLLSWIGSLLFLSPQALAATFTVTTVEDVENPDDGLLSLREAVKAANANPGMDTIAFEIDNATFPPPHLIAVGSGTSPGMPLPYFDDPVVIDGTTEPDYTPGSPSVVLDGTAVSPLADDPHGLFLNALPTRNAEGSTIRGLSVQNFPQRGLNIYTHGNLIEDNIVHSNGYGHPSANEGIITSVVNDNRILNNVVTGNHGHGIAVIGLETVPGTNNLIRGNRVTENGGDGLHMPGIQNKVLNNVFSGNAGHGIELISYWGGGNLVQGNFIGTDENGTELGNGQHGVLIWGDSHGNRIGGFDDEARRGSYRNSDSQNTIAYNGGDGVSVVSGNLNETINNSIRANAIFDNGGLGIDLEDDGKTPNDYAPASNNDTDIGANFLQNWPTVKSAHTVGDITTVLIRVSGELARDFEVDIYVNPEKAPTGFKDPSKSAGEGRFYVKTVPVSTPSGPHNLKIKTSFPAVDIKSGGFVTATTTMLTDEGSVDGSTSEFSGGVLIQGGGGGHDRSP